MGVQDQARASGLGYFFSQGANNPIYFCKKKKYTGDTSPAKANGMSSASLDGGWKIKAAPLMVRFRVFLSYINPKTPHQHSQNTQKPIHQLKIPEKGPKT